MSYYGNNPNVGADIAQSAKRRDRRERKAKPVTSILGQRDDSRYDSRDSNRLTIKERMNIIQERKAGRAALADKWKTRK